MFNQVLVSAASLTVSRTLKVTAGLAFHIPVIQACSCQVLTWGKKGYSYWTGKEKKWHPTVKIIIIIINTS